MNSHTGSRRCPIQESVQSRAQKHGDRSQRLCEVGPRPWHPEAGQHSLEGGSPVPSFPLSRLSSLLSTQCLGHAGHLLTVELSHPTGTGPPRDYLASLVVTSQTPEEDQAPEDSPSSQPLLMSSLPSPGEKTAFSALGPGPGHSGRTSSCGPLGGQQVGGWTPKWISLFPRPSFSARSTGMFC